MWVPPIAAASNDSRFDNEGEFCVGEIRKVARETFSMITEDVPGPSDAIIEDVVNNDNDRVSMGTTLSKTLHHRRSICDHPHLCEWIEPVAIVAGP